jgi:glycosyltransferase involved in cell wall biosynthesis
MHVVIAALSSARQPSGICRHAANLAATLAARPGTRATLLVGNWQDDYFRQAFGIKDGSTLRMLPVELPRHPLVRNAWYYLALPKIARECEADLLHLSFPAPIRRSAFTCPIVVSLHDLYPYDIPRNFGHIRVMFNRMFLRGCLRSSDAVICSSDFTLKRLQHCVPEIRRSKATRIYQMVTLDPRVAHAPTVPEPDGRPFLLSVAQHRSNKNLDLLLRAFVELRATTQLKHMRLIIVGAEGPETAKLYALLKGSALEDDVLFLSSVTDAELCWLYRNCELLVVPSSIEGFCLPVAEGLRCGSRILCSDIPVLREVGGPSCHFVDLSQSQPAMALAAAIQEALGRPVAAPQTADRFAAQEIGSQHLALYSTLLAKAGRPAFAEDDIPPADSVQYDRYAS